MEIMKMNGTMENYEGETFDWVCGEQEFSLVYDGDSELYGIEIDGIDKKILNDIVDNPWNYDFPEILEK